MALTKIKLNTGMVSGSLPDANIPNDITISGAQTGITQVGTLTAGTWQGTKIASAYLDDDTAHLSGSAFTGTISSSTSSTTDSVLTLTDAGVADYKFTFPDTGTMKLSTNTSSSKKFFLKNDGSGQFNFETDGEITIPSYLNIDQTAQNGIRIKTDDTAVIWVYDKTSDAITGGVNWGHSDGTTLFYTGGLNERFRITSDGKFGFGGITPTQKYEFRGDNHNDIMRMYDSANSHNIWLLRNEVHSGTSSGRLQLLKGDADGVELNGHDGRTSFIKSPLAIGGTTASEKLHIHDGDILVSSGRGVRANGGNEMIRFNSSNGVQINSGGSERVRVQTDGATLFGTLTRTATGVGGATFDPNSVGRCLLLLGSVNYTSSVDVARFYNDNGEVGDIRTDGSGASFNSNSDYRLKENEVSLSNALTRLNNLKPYRFNFKADENKTLDGFFAHEVQEVVPEAVTGTKDQMKAIQYQPEDEIPEGKEVYDIKEYSTTEIDPQKMDASKLVPLLVASVQELSAKVTALENA